MKHFGSVCSTVYERIKNVQKIKGQGEINLKLSYDPSREPLFCMAPNPKSSYIFEFWIADMTLNHSSCLHIKNVVKNVKSV